MTYSLSKLAPGSYDPYLNGALMGGVVRNGASARTLTAELLDLSEDGRHASLDATLDTQTAAGDVWLFAYGSLPCPARAHQDGMWTD
jgi:hypothetical protein